MAQYFFCSSAASFAVWLAALAFAAACSTLWRVASMECREVCKERKNTAISRRVAHRKTLTTTTQMVLMDDCNGSLLRDLYWLHTSPIPSP